MTIPETLTDIGENAFYECTNLRNVTMPGDIEEEYIDGKTIVKFIFNKCTNLSVNILDGSTRISATLFYDCKGLTNINIPKSVKSIGVDAFRGCTELRKVTLPGEITSEVNQSIFKDCTDLTAEILDGSEKISYDLFNNCPGLTGISIPQSVASIDDGAFNGCTGLKSVTMPGEIIKNGEEQTLFPDCTDLTVNITDGSTRITSGLLANCTGLTKINIPESVTEIGADAFSGCTGLKSVTMPGAMTRKTAKNSSQDAPT